MPLAGQHKIIIPVVDSFCRPPGNMCCQRSGQRRKIALTFLTTESSTHTPRFNGNSMLRKPEHIRGFFLNLAWMLSRAIKIHVAIFTRDSERRLTFEIKMFLPTNTQPPAKPPWRVRHGCCRSTFHHCRRRTKKGLRHHRIINCQNSR